MYYDALLVIIILRKNIYITLNQNISYTFISTIIIIFNNNIFNKRFNFIVVQACSWFDILQPTTFFT